MIKSSLILPIYRAASFLESSLEKVDEALSAWEGWELILVVDGSPDHSLALCQGFATQKRNYPVKVISFEKNLGKGAAVRRGMLEASGDYRIFTDCDLSYSMEEAWKVLEALKNKGAEPHHGAEPLHGGVAIASRLLEGSEYSVYPKRIASLRVRYLLSRLFNRLVRVILPLDYEDTQTGLKGFTRAAATHLFSQVRLNGFSFDIELLYLARRAGLKVVEVPIHVHYHDSSTIRFVSHGPQMIFDLLKIRYWTLQGDYAKPHDGVRPHDGAQPLAVYGEEADH